MSEDKKTSQQGQPKRIVTIISDNSKGGDRFIICDAVTGAVVDNAQGFGFKTHVKAENYALRQDWSVTNPYSEPDSYALF